MLIKCPECAKNISDTAPSCPHCGFRQTPPNPFEALPSYHAGNVAPLKAAPGGCGRAILILAAFFFGAIVLLAIIGSFVRTPPSATASRAPDKASAESATAASNHGPAVDPSSVPTPWLQDITKQYAGPSLNLKDPDSAIYTNTTYRTRHGVPYICGFVNAKNSFGGYTGPHAFIIGGDRTMLEGAAHFKQSWTIHCVQTDGSEAAAAMFHSAPPHATPSAVSDAVGEKVRPQLHLAPSDTAVFSRTTYRTRYGLPVTCGYVSINGAKPVRYVSTAGSADKEGVPLFENTWNELCTVTDASQDAEERAFDRHHPKP